MGQTPRFWYVECDQQMLFLGQLFDGQHIKRLSCCVEYYTRPIPTLIPSYSRGHFLGVFMDSSRKTARDKKGCAYCQKIFFF